MVRPSLVLTAALFAFAVGGCSGIRVVKKTQDGGVVALQGVQSDARVKADEYMRAQCGGEYEVVEEGEAVVGSDTETRKTNTFLGPATTAHSTDRNEWRITFKCKAAKPAAALHSVIVRF
jgi:hypothetical protein